MKPASKMAEMGRTWGPVDITEPTLESTPKPTLPLDSELPHGIAQGRGHIDTAGHMNSGSCSCVEHPLLSERQ